MQKTTNGTLSTQLTSTLSSVAVIQQILVLPGIESQQHGTITIVFSLYYRHMQVVFKANGNCERKPTIEFNGEVPSPGAITYVRM